MKKKNNSLFDKQLVNTSLVEAFPQARSSDHDQEPDHVHRGTGDRHHAADVVLHRLHGRPVAGFVRVQSGDLLRAAADDSVRQFRRSDRRSARQGAGREPAQDPRGDSGQAGNGQRCRESGQQLATEKGRCVRMLRRRYDSCRRRDHRGPCLDRRERHHGRVGSGDPRGGRRQKLRDGRYESIVGPDRRQSDRQARARVSSTR